MFAMSPSTVLPAEGPACSTVVQCVVTLVEVQPLDRMLRGHQSDSCDGRGASVETGDVLLSILKAGYIIYIHPVVLTQHP